MDLSFKNLGLSIAVIAFSTSYAGLNIAKSDECGQVKKQNFFSSLASSLVANLATSSNSHYKIFGEIAIDNSFDHQTPIHLNIVVENNDGSEKIIKPKLEICDDPDNEALVFTRFQTGDKSGTVPIKTYKGGRYSFKVTHQDFELDIAATYCNNPSNTCLRTFKKFTSDDSDVYAPIHLKAIYLNNLEENKNFTSVQKCLENFNQCVSDKDKTNTPKFIKAWKTSINGARKRGKIDDFLQLALLMKSIFQHEDINQEDLVREYKDLIHMPLELIRRQSFINFPAQSKYSLLRDFAVAYTYSENASQIVYRRHTFAYYVDEFFIAARDQVYKIAETGDVDVYKYRSIFKEYHRYMMGVGEYLLASETVVEYFDLHKTYNNKKLPPLNNTTLSFVDAWLRSNYQLSGNTGRNFSAYIDKMQSSPMFRRQWQDFSVVLAYYATDIKEFRKTLNPPEKISAQKEGILQAHRLLEEILS